MYVFLFVKKSKSNIILYFKLEIKGPSLHHGLVMYAGKMRYCSFKFLRCSWLIFQKVTNKEITNKVTVPARLFVLWQKKKKQIMVL